MNGERKHGRVHFLVKIALLILFGAGCVFLGMRALKLREDRLADTANQETPKSQPWSLAVAAVRQEDLVKEFPALALLTSKAEIVVNGQLAGVIVKMGPREGVTVKKGDLLAEIDTREISENIRSTEAKLRSAESATANLEIELEREKSLLKVGGTTKSRVDALQTAVLESKDAEEALRRNIGSLKVRQGYAVVRSPADGVIAARLTEPGAVCSLAHPLYRVTVSKGARVSLKLPQGVIEKVKPGTTFTLSHHGEEMKVVISRVHPSLDARALGTVESDLEERPFGLPSGARIQAQVVVGKRAKALIIPGRAFLPIANGRHGKVFKIKADNEGGGQHLEEVRVLADLFAGSDIAVVGDLQADDRIVVAHRSTLQRIHDKDSFMSSDGGK